MDVRQSYDAAAKGYADHLADELRHKPLDRHLLNRFGEGVSEDGLVADLGCGPGQVAGYLHRRGTRMIGIDLSSAMLDEARRLHPEVEFRQGDLTLLDLPDGELSGAVAFYAIVHFTPEQLEPVFREICRVMRPGGLFLVSFHVGDAVVHVEDLFGATVSLDFRFHEPAAVEVALKNAGFKVIERTEREPYPEVEYPSRRAYLLAVAIRQG